MTWFKVDDSFHTHPKVLTATASAIALWVRAGSWAADQLTDGAVPNHIVRIYGGTRAAHELVKLGLWSAESEGYRFHDWSVYQPTREQVLAEREAAAERQRRGREKQRLSRANSHRESHRDVRPESRRDERRDIDVTSPVSHGGPDPTRPVVTEVTKTRDPTEASGQTPTNTNPDIVFGVFPGYVDPKTTRGMKRDD